MEVKFKLSKYDILGVASIIGASEEEMKMIKKYINENKSVEINLSNEDTEIKTGICALVVAQIAKILIN